MSFFGNLSTLFSQQGTTKPLPQKGHARVKPKPSTKKNVLTRPKKFKPAQRPVASARPHPDEQTMLREAKAKAREIIVEAKDEALALKTKSEQLARQKEQQLESQQRSLANKLDSIDQRLGLMDAKEQTIEKEEKKLENNKQQLQQTKKKIIEKLESVSGLTRDEARDELLDAVSKKTKKEMAQLIRQKEEEAKQEADGKAQEILVEALRHGATDYVPEYTISTVTLPSEEVKGKIIGRSGRNIQKFEKETGVDVDLDASPTEVRLSCFDAVRREIARLSLERLIKDGRIQPTRIEEVISKVRSDVDKILFEAGKKLCHDVNVYNLPNELMRLIGKFKFRFSYGQNLIAHTLEETRIGIKLAHELNVDVNTVRLGCLLHDIGKVAEEVEGSHVELGVKIAKRFGLPQPVIDCIAQHHEDEPFTGPEQMIVYIADAVSGARPGARYENHEEYVARLKKLEEIATQHAEVKEAYAIQAGREVRVLLKPESTKDDDVHVIAGKIRDEVKERLTFPGTVTVTVMRETRGQKVAK